MLAIVDSVRHFGGVLQWHPVSILTDHRPLVAFMSSLQTNQMMIRWQESPNQLDITMEHIDGKTNMIEDTLSQTYKDSVSSSSEQSLLSTDHTYSTPVLPTIATQDLSVTLPTSTTLHFTTSMPSQPTTRRRMSNMTGRCENTDEYDPEDLEHKVDTESDESRRV